MIIMIRHNGLNRMLVGEGKQFLDQFVAAYPKSLSLVYILALSRRCIYDLDGKFISKNKAEQLVRYLMCVVFAYTAAFQICICLVL